MAVEGENLGIASIYLTVDTTSMDAGIAKAKTKLSGMSAEAEKQYTAMNASQRKVAESLVKQAELINKTTAERIAYNAQLKVGGALGDEIARKAVANAQAVTGAQQEATAAAKAADAAKAEMAAADDARFKQIAVDAMAEVEARKAVTAATMEQARANAALSDSRIAGGTVSAKSGAAAAVGALDSATVQQQIADYAALDAVMTKKVVTTKEVAAAEAALDRLQKEGMISSEELAATFAALDAATAADTKALQSNTVANLENAGAKKLNSRTAYSISALLSDLSTGQISRSRREIAAVANETGAISKLFSPLGIAIGGTIAVLALFGRAVYSREQDLLAFNKALAATGNAAGTTGLQLQGIAAEVGQSTGDYSNATKAVLALAKSGDVLGADMRQMATTAVNMAYLTGQSVDKVVNELIKLQGDPTQAIAKATAAMGLLTTAQYNQIVETQRTQGVTAAAALAMKDLGDASDTARRKLVDNAGVVIRTWNNVKSLFHDVGSEIASIGATQSIGEQIAGLQNQLNVAYTAAVGGGAPDPNKDPAVVQLRAQIAALQLRQQAQAMFDRGQQLAAEGKRVHDQALAEALASNKGGDVGFVAQAAAINKKRYAALVGIVDPATREQINAAYDQQIRDAVKRANLQLPHGGGSAHANPALTALRTFQSQAASFVDKSVIDPSGDKALTAFDQNIRKLNADFDKAIAKHADLAAASAAYRQGVDALNRTLAKQEAQEKGVTDAYGRNLDRLLASKENAIQIEVASVGMGAKEAAQMKELNAITQQQVQADQKLNDQRAKGTLSQTQYNTELAKSDAYFAKLRADTISGYAQMDAAQSNWVNGAIAALQDWSDQGANVAAQTKTLFTNAFTGMNDALITFATTGKLTFRSFVTSILTDLAKMELRIAESSILKSLLGAFLGSSSQGQMATGFDSNNTFFGFANGGVFNSPSLSQYSGGVYDSPKLFKFASGGVFGEAGPEAIMPLSRGRDGKLGVKAAGAGNVININTNVVVDHNGARSTTSSDGSDAAARQLGAMMEAKAKEVVSRAVQPGGLLWRHGVGQAA